MVKVVARSHQGLVRLRNEDAVYGDDLGRFAILADGMGGLMAGEVASRTAVEVARIRLSRGTSPIAAPDDLEHVLQLSHDAVVARARKFNYVGKMGTTMLIWARADVSASQPENSFFAHVGDSRIYTFTEGKLTQITRDHTLAQRRADSGETSPEEESEAPDRHVLTQALGLPGLCKPDSGIVPPAQRLVMCSDGLTDLVSEADIVEVMATPDLGRCADDLLKAALDAGGRDNVSVVLLEF